MINHISHDYPILEQINYEDRRVYKFESKEYPSITTIISKMADASWLEEWKSRVGVEASEKISKYATIRGSALHSYCEDYLNNKIPAVNYLDIEVYNQVKQFLTRVNNVHAIENRLVSERLELAGTVDLIAEYDGVLSIIDWKTSKRIKSKDDIPDYFIQCSFYALAFYEMFGIRINQLIIVMAIDGHSEPLIFIENIKNWLSKLIDLRKRFKLKEGY